MKVFVAACVGTGISIAASTFWTSFSTVANCAGAFVLSGIFCPVSIMRFANYHLVFQVLIAIGAVLLGFAFFSKGKIKPYLVCLAFLLVNLKTLEAFVRAMSV